MAATLISGILGSLIFVLCFLVTIMNLSVLYVLIIGGFLKSNKSSIYIFAFSNIAGYMFQSITGFYLGISSFAQDWLFSDGVNNYWVFAISLIFLGQWFQEMFMQAIVAIDRLVVVVLPGFSWLFARRVVIFISLTILPLGMCLAYIANFVIPCCREYIYYAVYANTYISNETEYNYVDTYVNLPVNIITSGIAMFSYTIIYIYVKRARTTVLTNVKNNMNSNRKKKEIRYALQFAAMSCFILFSWLCFIIFPHVVPRKRTDLYPIFSLGAFLFLIHCGVNSMIFLTINTEVKKENKFSSNINTYTSKIIIHT